MRLSFRIWFRTPPLSHTHPSAPFPDPYIFEGKSPSPPRVPRVALLTSPPRALASSAVLRFRQLVASLLLALWLPAALHCDLEAADFHFLHTAETPAANASHAGCASTAEICHPVESATYTATLSSLKVPPPGDSLLALLAALADFSSDFEDNALSSERHPPPLELRVAWQFIARAAPPSRAPTTHV